MPGAQDAIRQERTTPSRPDARRRPPEPGERINPGSERSHRSTEQTKPAIQHTQRWTPPRRFAGFGAKTTPSASQRATVNPYGITLDRTWTKWAAKQGVPDTIAAALYLISENRKTDEVVVKLRPSEIERVIDIVQCWPDRFPPGALAAIRRRRPAPLPQQSTACTSPGPRHRSAARFNLSIGQLHPNGPARSRAAVQGGTERTPAQKPVRAELNGGVLTVETSHHGTTFILKLPSFYAGRWV
jgi:hypothetical protein